MEGHKEERLKEGHSDCCAATRDRRTCSLASWSEMRETWSAMAADCVRRVCNSVILTSSRRSVVLSGKIDTCVHNFSLRLYALAEDDRRKRSESATHPGGRWKVPNADVLKSVARLEDLQVMLPVVEPYVRNVRAET